MIRLTEVKLPLTALAEPAAQPSDAHGQTDADASGSPHPMAALQAQVRQRLGVSDAEVIRVQVFKRSFDARKAALFVVYTLDVQLQSADLESRVLLRQKGNAQILPTPDMDYCLPRVSPRPAALRPVVVGFGPCGIFAALLLAQMGLAPIVLERGKPVRLRTRDTWNLWRKQVLTPESNVQFGEGGAGTFSDGKLYSQIKDPRHLGRKVMQELVAAGAPPEILFEAHPHIGTFKLVKVVESLRARIIELGGEVRFEQRVVDLDIALHDGRRVLRGLSVLDQASGKSSTLQAERVILALGHSARDTFAMLHQRGVALHAKPFSIGFRIEHPQSLIDRARWGRHAGQAKLGAADYRLVHHASNGRTVYSFCMCPGGTVVAATSEPGRVVTNGMSQYSRNERNANAGLVVGVDPSDFANDLGAFVEAFGPQDGARYASQAQALRDANPRAVHPLSGINLQRQLESAAYVLGGSDYRAPAQLLGDFLRGVASDKLGSVEPSYQPGVRLTSLHQNLPGYAIDALREALPAFGRQLTGYDRPDAVLTGVETRTSSPLRIPRNEALQSLNTHGLFPGGEGAGYAGGILSAAVDGIKLAEALARSLQA